MSTAEPATFPRWIRLRAVADYSQRNDVTNRVSDSIPKSGGFLSNSNLLSDMVTTLVMEDVCPVRLPQFRASLENIDGLELDTKSVELFDDCCHQLDERANDGTIPDHVNGILQLNWRDAPGTLRQRIVADG